MVFTAIYASRFVATGSEQGLADGAG